MSGGNVDQKLADQKLYKSNDYSLIFWCKNIGNLSISNLLNFCFEYNIILIKLWRKWGDIASILFM